MPSEIQLIILAKAGDKQAINDLASKAFECVVPYLLHRYYRSISQEDAEDAFQDAIIEFLENPLSVSAKTDKQFYKWVLVTSERKILDLLKSADYIRKVPLITLGNDENEEIAMQFEAPENVEKEAINHEITEIIKSELDKLPEIDKIIICDYCNGYSLKEIAMRVGLSYDNVRQRKRRTISRLRMGRLKEIQ